MTSVVCLLWLMLVVSAVLAQLRTNELQRVQSLLAEARQQLAAERSRQSSAQYKVELCESRLARTRGQLLDAAREIALAEARCQMLANAADFHRAVRSDLKEIGYGR